jgi:DNA modification methylase
LGDASYIVVIVASIPTGLFLADSLSVLGDLPSESIDLIYIDPPFGTGQRRRLRSIRTGVGDRLRRGFGDKMHRWEPRSDLAFLDTLAMPDYLAFLSVCLEEAYRVLKGSGSIYVHLDFHAVHHVRLIMDEIFGSERFLNEIIWSYDFGGRANDRWPRKHDNILWYAKGDRWTFRRDDVERIPYMAPELVGPEKAERGKLPTDVWWMTIVPTNGHERTGYPTQKPEKLLERIIRASSSPGDIVMDFFAGSGTTGVVAQRLGRRFLLVDNNPDAVKIASERLSGSRHNDTSERAGDRSVPASRQGHTEDQERGRPDSGEPRSVRTHPKR